MKRFHNIRNETYENGYHQDKKKSVANYEVPDVVIVYSHEPYCVLLDDQRTFETSEQVTNVTFTAHNFERLSK